MRMKCLRVVAPLIIFLVFMTYPHLQTVLAVNSPEKSTLKITNLAAPDHDIPDDLYFLLQVKVDGLLLPEGTIYVTENESRTIETAGQMLLRVNETIVLENMFLPESKFQITELSAALDGYQPVYEGAVTSDGSMESSVDGISGIFPTDGEVHITVVNAANNSQYS